MIELGFEQKEALSMMLRTIADTDVIACLVYGSAGTGKSILINNLVKELETKGIQYCLCAPTHKAALVVERYTNRDALTLHKLLSLSPNLDIFELDFNNLLFRVGKSQTHMPYNGVVICDEASMINDDLYKLLLSKAHDNRCHICFFGDFKQLAPVKQGTQSLIISTEPQVELTKIYRQSSENGLLPILEELRNHSIGRFEESPGIEGSLEITNDVKDFLKHAKIQFEQAIKKADILETKITAFTNNRVYAYNQTMHKVLFSDDAEYHKGEFITGCDNLEFNCFKFYNSMDYIVINEPTKTDLYIPDFMKLPAWQVELYDSLERRSGTVAILSKEVSADYLEALAQKMEQLRLTAVELRQISCVKANKFWNRYYNLIGSFTTSVPLFFDNRLVRKKSFDYGYAATTHRLQGSNYNNILVDMKNIGVCKDEEARRQLQYVALSRTRNNALVFQ